LLHAGPESIEAELAKVEVLGLEELRVRWRKLFRAAAPPHLPGYLLVRIIAYRLQAKRYGDLDRETVRFLDKVARDRVVHSDARGQAGKAKTAVVPPVPERRSIKPGSRLVREHDGKLHEVTVLVDGFSWNGATYKSLSEVARAITGTNWNGPRFFGLRDKAAGRAGCGGQP
jgi:hypothetical protein